MGSADPRPRFPTGEGSSLQPCDVTCLHAEAFPCESGLDDWLWCHRPDQSHRLTARDRDCPHHTPDAPHGVTDGGP